MKRCAIVGAGISGLTAAYYLSKASSLSVDVYDVDPQPGGLLKTEIIEDCVVDAGPDSFLTQKQAAWDLIDELNLRSEVIGSNDSIRSTFIFHEGKLKKLPDGFFLMVPQKVSPFLKTELLSWPGKLEALSDLFALPEMNDVSVGEFIENRFGSEILQRIAEPLLAGIYGTDIHRLSLRSSLPEIWELQKKGSLLLQLQKRRSAKKPDSLFTTFRAGMQTLARAVEEKAEGVRWKLGSKIDEIGKEQDLWNIQGELYDTVLISSSSFPRINSQNGVKIGAILNSIHKNSAIVIALGFLHIHPQGFGWLVPEHERRSVLACTYVSNKFPARMPADRFLIRLFIGGEAATKWIERSDSEVETEARSELQRIAGISAEPIFSRVYRWKNSMPEYQVGHSEKVEAVAMLTTLERGLYISGNLMNGVGIPDCIFHARKTAAELVQFLGN